jgi:alkane 1-monooxygenase
MKKFKYFSIFLLPITVYVSFTVIGILSFLPVFIFFGLLPAIELFIKPNADNIDVREGEIMKNDLFYDWLLYLIVPIQFIFLVFFLYSISEQGLSLLTIAGRIASMGMMCGVIGINLGHELGHRTSRVKQFLGELLLLTSLENHFLPYHNNGHHRNVATPKDPATSRKGEVLYLFWVRSHFGSYFQAWEFEWNKLKKQDKNPLSFNNRMVTYTIAQLGLLVLTYFSFGKIALLAFLAAALFGILLLETINYIEHYGLLRKINERGNYEKVQHQHSWNSDHVIGRVMLFELSRHSDHHYKASKQYQILDSMPQSPQMPTGYPGMMILALFPPLWFKFMNKRVEQLALENK